MSAARVEILGRYSRMFSLVVKLQELLEQPEAQFEPLPRRQKQRQVRLNPEQIEEFRYAYLAGMSVKDLATEFGINRNTVHDHIRRQDLPLRHRGLTPADAEEAAVLYRSGLSLAKVSAKLGTHMETTRQALMKAGVEIRKRNGWEQRSQSGQGGK